MCISRATVSAVSCLVVPAFICIDLLISLVLKINDDDDDDDSDFHIREITTKRIQRTSKQTSVIQHLTAEIINLASCLRLTQCLFTC